MSLDCANGSHCCFSTATMVTRRHNNVTIHIHFNFANKQVVDLTNNGVREMFVCRYFRLQGSVQSRKELSRFDSLSCCKVRIV